MINRFATWLCHKNGEHFTEWTVLEWWSEYTNEYEAEWTKTGVNGARIHILSLLITIFITYIINWARNQTFISNHINVIL